MTLIKSLLLLSLYLFFSLSATATDNVVADGEYAIASKFSLESHILGEAREFYVSLPVSYEGSDTSYPVIIILDGGQNIEHAVASARMLSQWKGLPETIVVAIPSTSRIRDFTPSLDANYAEESGGAGKFVQFIEKELMQFVDSSFRTHPFRVLVGHSLGGIFAAHQFIEGNAFFNAYIILAPSLWWNGHEIIAKVSADSFALKNSETSVFLGIGDLDGWGMRQELQQFQDGLSSQISDPNLLKHKEFASEGHMSITLPALYEGLQHVFSGSIYDKSQWPNFTSESFTAFIGKVKQVYGHAVVQTGELYVSLAQFLIEKQDYEGAITVLKANIASYPNYPFNHDLLANTYALNNQNQLAIEEYENAAKYALASESFGEGDAQGYLDAAEQLMNPVVISPEVMQGYTGCYFSDSGTMFRFSLEEGNLVGSRKDWADFRLFADGQNSFFMRTEPKLALTFNERQLDIVLHGTSYSFSKQPCS